MALGHGVVKFDDDRRYAWEEGLTVRMSVKNHHVSSCNAMTPRIREYHS